MANEMVLADIDSVLRECSTALGEYPEGAAVAPSGESTVSIETRLMAQLQAAIHRTAPPGSSYPPLADKVNMNAYRMQAINLLTGILTAIRADYAADRIKTFQELVHSDLFADMLEAAEYLLGESYKDPAAVMAGGVLEQHLRELCRKHLIDTTFTTPGGDTKPKMIDTMNADLAKASAYGKIEQKQVTAWAGIRNAAAHGKYGEYDGNQVRQMVTGIRDFIGKYPA